MFVIKDVTFHLPNPYNKKSRYGRCLSHEISHELRELDNLFREYLPKIVRLAEHNLAPRYRRLFDADDIGATVVRTVARRIGEGTFEFDDEESLWKQLVTITLRRISNKIRYANAHKRGGGQAPVTLDNLAAIARTPDPSHAVALAEVMTKIGEELDEKGRKVLEMRMANLSYEEIATELSVSERTVGRKIELIKELLSKQLELEN